MFEDTDIPSLLKTLDPKARDKLRRVLIHDLIDFFSDSQGGTAEGVATARRDLRPRSDVRRARQAGERRGTRPLFASPRDDAKPAPFQAPATVRDQRLRQARRVLRYV